MAIILVSLITIISCGSEKDESKENIETLPSYNRVPEIKEIIAPEGIFAGTSFTIKINAKDADNDDLIYSFIIEENINVEATVKNNILNIQTKSLNTASSVNLSISVTDTKGAKVSKKLSIDLYPTPNNKLTVTTKGDYCLPTINGLECENEGDSYAINTMPAYRYVSELSLGIWHGCAITQGKLKCWVYPYSPSIETDAPESAYNLFVAGQNTQCGTVDKQVKCWGNWFPEQVQLAENLFNNYDIASIESDGFYGSGIKDRTLTVFHSLGESSTELNWINATKIAIDGNGGSNVCILYESQKIECYKVDYFNNNNGTYPIIKNPNSAFLSEMNFSEVSSISMNNSALMIATSENLYCYNLGSFTPCDASTYGLDNVEQIVSVRNRSCFLRLGSVHCLDFDNVDNNAPVADSDTYRIWENNSIEGQLNASDLDGDVLEYQLVKSPSYGDFELISNGGFTYQADKTYVGDDSFTFRVSDAKTFSADKDVTISIFNDPVLLTTKPFLSDDLDILNWPYTTSTLIQYNAVGSPEPIELKSFTLIGLGDAIIKNISVTSLSNIPCYIDGISNGQSISKGDLIELRLFSNWYNSGINKCSFRVELDFENSLMEISTTLHKN